MTKHQSIALLLVLLLLGAEAIVEPIVDVWRRPPCRQRWHAPCAAKQSSLRGQNEWTTTPRNASAAAIELLSRALIRTQTRDPRQLDLMSILPIALPIVVGMMSGKGQGLLGSLFGDAPKGSAAHAAATAVSGAGAKPAAANPLGAMLSGGGGNLLMSLLGGGGGGGKSPLAAMLGGGGGGGASPLAAMLGGGGGASGGGANPLAALMAGGQNGGGGGNALASMLSGGAGGGAGGSGGNPLAALLGGQQGGGGGGGNPLAALLGGGGGGGGAGALMQALGGAQGMSKLAARVGGQSSAAGMQASGSHHGGNWPPKRR